MLDVQSLIHACYMQFCYFMHEHMQTCQPQKWEIKQQIFQKTPTGYYGNGTRFSQEKVEITFQAAVKILNSLLQYRPRLCFLNQEGEGFVFTLLLLSILYLSPISSTKLFFILLIVICHKCLSMLQLGFSKLDKKLKAVMERIVFF